MAQTQESRKPNTEVMDAIAALRAALQKECAQGGIGKEVDLRFTEVRGRDYGQGPGYVECKITFLGKTADEAHEMAKDYDEGGWICVDSGETEVTCKTPDEA